MTVAKSACLSICFLLALYLPSSTIGTESEGQQPLFDGKSLDGWVQRGGKASYAVEDGCIVGRSLAGTPNSFLCTERDYENFLLTLEFKVDNRINSGVQIRSQSLPEYHSGRVHGYQVEIDPSARAWSGGIYDEGRRGWLQDLKDKPQAQQAFRKDEWNTFRIECVGPRIRTWLNGMPAADLQDDMTLSGFIALQVHASNSPEPLEIRWRNIRITDWGRSGTTREVLGDPAEKMGAPAPEHAITLLGSSGDVSEWQPVGRPEDAFPWQIENGVLQVVPGKGSVETKRSFTDFHLHLEFCTNAKEKHSQDDGNSGVYIQRRYEIQILNSNGRPPGLDECAAIYRTKAPDVNASRPDGEWQSYDLVFRSPRWDAGGKKSENARISLSHNGILVHDNVEIPDKTGAGRAEGAEPGPILLQDHGNPVRFRNIWVEELNTVTAAQSELDTLCSALQTYEFGASREPLSRIETIVAKARSEGERADLEERFLLLVGKREAPWAAREFACRMLARVGTERTIPVLAGLLGDQALSDMARYALTPLPSADVDTAFRKALGYSMSPASRCGLIASIGERRDRNALPHLQKLAQSSEPGVADAAVRAIGNIGGPEALAFLEHPAAVNASGESIARALLDAAARAAADGENTVAERVFRNLTAATYSSPVRAAAYQGLASRKGAAVVSEVIDLLAGTDGILRAAAPRILTEIPGTEVTLAVAARVPSLPMESQISAFSVLLERGDAACVPAIIGQLAGLAPEGRASVARVLGALGGSECVPILAEMAVQTGATGDAAAAALARLAGEKTDAELIQVLTAAPTPAMCLSVIRALVARGSRAAVPQLLVLATGDSDRNVQRECWKALRELAGAADLPAFLEVMKTTDDAKVVREAERAVGAAAERMTDAEKRTDLLLEALASTPAIRPAIVTLLGRFGGERACQVLIAQLNADNPEVRYAAVKALAQWSDPSPADALLQYARTTDLETHHVLALRGYARMLSEMPLEDNVLRARVQAALPTARREEEKNLLNSVMLALRITDLRAKSGKTYRLVPKGFAEGNPIYTDREYTLTHVPDILTNADLIMTAMNDKYSQGDDFLTFRVNHPVTVYVCADHRAKEKPKWLAGWVKAGEALLSTDKSCRLELFSRMFPAGPIAIGGNKVADAAANYVIGIAPSLQ